MQSARSKIFDVPLDIGGFRCYLVVVWELRRAAYGAHA